MRRITCLLGLAAAAWGQTPQPKPRVILKSGVEKHRTGEGGAAFDAAARRMNMELGRGDFVWVDGYAGNVFYHRDAAGRAGLHGGFEQSFFPNEGTLGAQRSGDGAGEVSASKALRRRFR